MLFFERVDEGFKNECGVVYKFHDLICGFKWRAIKCKNRKNIVPRKIIIPISIITIYFEKNCFGLTEISK